MSAPNKLTLNDLNESELALLIGYKMMSKEQQEDFEGLINDLEKENMTTEGK